MSFAVAGDSLLSPQSSGMIVSVAEHRCHTVLTAGRPGGTPCDLLPSYGAVMSAVDPPLRRVALSWVGNVGQSPCMLEQMSERFGTTRWGDDPNHDGPATLTPAEIDYAGYLYEIAVRAMVRWNLGNNIATVLVLPPPMRAGTYHNQMEAELLTRYTTVADAYGGVWTTSTPRQLLGGDTWVGTIAGLPIRHTDYVHLAGPLGIQLWADGIVDAVTA